jgi:hypothetical protein
MITSFWEGVGDNMRSAFNDAIPEGEQMLQKRLATNDSEVKTIEENHALIRKVAEQELEARKGSTEKDATRKLVHLIAMVDPESVAAWHRLLQTTMSRAQISLPYSTWHMPIQTRADTWSVKHSSAP